MTKIVDKLPRILLPLYKMINGKKHHHNHININ